jgi:hypothetical protein
MCESKAPFVVVENPRMHPMATNLMGGRKPSQIVQPYEHGTGHEKATGIYIVKGQLPLLRPTCLMQERVLAMADLPPSPHRGALRSRTYVGIAAAMAVQWMSELIKYCKETKDPREFTAEQMVMVARLSLSSTPPNALPLKTLSHGDTEPRTAPIQLGGGGAKEERSLEDSQKPWIDPPARKSLLESVWSRLLISDEINGRRIVWMLMAFASGIRSVRLSESRSPRSWDRVEAATWVQAAETVEHVG